MTLKYELREVASHTKMDLSSQPGSKKSEVTERSDSPPLHIAEQVKFRMEGRGKSPIGTLSVYEKRVVWTDQDNPTVKSFAVSFSEVQSMKISSPDRPKVQLQLVMQGDRQATFVFMNPLKDKSGLINERDVVKDVLSDALLQYRRKAKEAEKQERSDATHADVKKQALMNDPHLCSLYKRLVGPGKFITIDDFWSMHLPKEVAGPSGGAAQPGRMGVSAGFLASVVDTAGYGGIKLNLSLETRQAIFRTYPAVERKYLEMVPHEMHEEEFWKKFFESHYFHRERSETDPKDTFFDCLKLDEQDMQLIQAQSAAIVKRQRDLSNLDDDMGLVSEIRSNQVPTKGSLAKALLMRRCNYHSERILEDIKNGSAQAATVNGGTTEEGQQASTSQFDLELDSHELQELTDEDAVIGAPRQLDLKPAAGVSASVKEEELEMDKRHRELGREWAEYSVCNLAIQGDSTMISRSDRFIDMLVDMEDAAGEADEPMTNGNAHGEAPTMNDLSPAAMEEVRTVHHCLSELLRHYWRCHPLTTPELREKARRMVDSLLRFEKGVIDECGAKYGEFSVEHCRFMLDKAKTHYENTTRQQQK